jgi:hypothetical protein
MFFLPEDDYESFEEAVSFCAFSGGGAPSVDGMHAA